MKLSKRILSFALALVLIASMAFVPRQEAAAAATKVTLLPGEGYDVNIYGATIKKVTSSIYFQGVAAKSKAYCTLYLNSAVRDSVDLSKTVFKLNRVIRSEKAKSVKKYTTCKAASVKRSGSEVDVTLTAKNKYKKNVTVYATVFARDKSGNILALNTSSFYLQKKNGAKTASTSFYLSTDERDAYDHVTVLYTAISE